MRLHERLLLSYERVLRHTAGSGGGSCALLPGRDDLTHSSSSSAAQHVCNVCGNGEGGPRNRASIALVMRAWGWLSCSGIIVGVVSIRIRIGVIAGFVSTARRKHWRGATAVSLLLLLLLLFFHGGEKAPADIQPRTGANRRSAMEGGDERRALGLLRGLPYQLPRLLRLLPRHVRDSGRTKRRSRSGRGRRRARVMPRMNSLHVVEDVFRVVRVVRGGRWAQRLELELPSQTPLLQANTQLRAVGPPLPPARVRVPSPSSNLCIPRLLRHRAPRELGALPPQSHERRDCALRLLDLLGRRKRNRLLLLLLLRRCDPRYRSGSERERGHMRLRDRCNGNDALLLLAVASQKDRSDNDAGAGHKREGNSDASNR